MPAIRPRSRKGLREGTTLSRAANHIKIFTPDSALSDYGLDDLEEHRMAAGNTSETWGFKLLAQTDLNGFGGMGEGMAVQIAPDGRRIIWLAHESAPKNFTAVDVSDPRKPKVVVQTDLPQPYMRSNSLELTGNIMAVAYQTQQPGPEARRLRAVRHLGAGAAEVDRVRRCVGAAFARRASALVLRRRIRAHGRGRARLQADPPARRPVLPLHRRAQSVKAGRGRPLVDARHAARRFGSPARASADGSRQPRPQHQRLSAAAGPPLSRLHRRRHVHHGHRRQGEPEADLPLGQFAALHRLHPHGAAAVRRATCWW